ncbi:MAG: FAD-dependent oxidoreductase [Ignavibacteria bacterium]|nr:FAD-dependent oxidoreductase [Ignavibacteria bacterium]
MKKKLAVLGTGFGAFSALKELDTDLYDITVISPRNHFLFTPLLPSTTVGTLEFRSIIEPIRNIKDIYYIQAECIKIDEQNNMLICRDTDTEKEFNISYDILFISVGEVTNTYGIEGVKEYALFLREVTDSRRIRIKVINCFENASLPGISKEERKNFLRFVVCGGGPTGVEFAAELHDFIEEDVSRKYPELKDDIEIILIEAGNKLLNSFDKKLSEYTMKAFKRQKIKVKINQNINKVTKNEIYVSNGNHFKYSILVWAAGNSPSELVKTTSLPKDNRYKILTDDYLRVIGHENIYAIGDCSEIPGKAFPVTAQTAQIEGKYTGKLLNKLAKGKKVKTFKYRDFGMLAYIGSHKALANLNQYKGSGFATWIFWRSVYVTKLVSLKNKILVLFDWFKTFVFGRDVSNF